MFKYIVVHMVTEEVDPDGVFDGGLDEDEAFSPDVKNLILCKDKKEVEEAIKSILKSQDESAPRGWLDWAVFEVCEEDTGKKVGAFHVFGAHAKRNAVVFETDGETIRSIQ